MEMSPYSDVAADTTDSVPADITANVAPGVAADIPAYDWRYGRRWTETWRGGTPYKSLSRQELRRPATSLIEGDCSEDEGPRAEA